MSRCSTVWRALLVSTLCVALNLASAMGAVQTATDNKAILPSKSEVGSSDNDLSLAFTNYVEKLHRALDDALLQAFWKFGDAIDYSRGAVTLRCAVSPSGRFWVEKVLGNTSNAIFAYAAEDAVRTANPPAFPPELVRYVPTGLSMEIGFSYQDISGMDYIATTQYLHPSYVCTHGLGTYIEAIRPYRSGTKFVARQDAPLK